VTINRRHHERFVMSPMYTPVSVRLLDSERFSLEGHAYDISEGGMMFELDRAIEAGTPIAAQITLSEHAIGDIGPGRSIFVFGNVVWADDSDAGPVRLALAFTQFARLGDKERLLRQLGSGRYARAA
jgi:hypothetical protein